MEYLGNKKNDYLLKTDTLEYYCDVIKNFVKSYKYQYNFIKSELKNSKYQNSQSKPRIFVINFQLNIFI